MSPDAVERTRRAVRDLSGTRGRGAVPAVPDTVPMTATERNTLGLIMKYESGGRNVMNRVGVGEGLGPTTPFGHTAQGYFQMLNSNWRKIAPGLGIKTPNAMASTLEEQTRVALALLRSGRGQRGGGVENWANYNPSLRAAISRGERVAAGAVPSVSLSAADTKSWLGSNWKDGKPLGALLDPSWAKNWHDTISSSSKLREALQPGSLSAAARAAGVGGNGGPLSVNTDGNVKVELTAHGFGKGLRARTAMDGIVGSVKLNRGSAMPVASNRD